jgi:hydroxymethylbilane synthase
MMNNIRILKLGTRPSALALAQSRLVKKALEEDHPKLKIELVKLKTRGDRDRQTPLTMIKDKNFFNSEIDEALLSGEIDFSVHSLKDLPLERPESIAIAAIPERDNPRDIILFRSDVMEKISSGKAIRIGTSSTRRAEGIKYFLPKALPNNINTPVIEACSVRGPIDQRLKLLQDKKLDGLVLAIAGLNRLFNDIDGYKIIAPLLKNLRRMVLPISEFPCTPGQAALAIECRAEDSETRLLLGSLLDEETAKLAMTERALLSDVPENQQNRYSATAVSHPVLNVLLWVNENDSKAPRLHWLGPVAPKNARAWDQKLPSGFRQYRALPVITSLADSPAAFIAHYKALPASEQLTLPQRIWTSGIRSWHELAARGIWIEGCAENLGFDSLKVQLTSPALELAELKDWVALTHADAVESWKKSGIGKVTPTYRIETNEIVTPELKNSIRSCSHFFWSSFNEYKALEMFVPDHAHHACGPGKTLNQLNDYGLWTVDVFPSRKEWCNWINS